MKVLVKGVGVVALVLAGWTAFAIRDKRMHHMGYGAPPGL